MTTLTPRDFVVKWERAEARERQSVHEHFIGLCTRGVPLENLFPRLLEQTRCAGSAWDIELK